MATGLRAGLDRLIDHPWLVGDPDTPGRTVGRRARWMAMVAVLVANAVGVAVVLCFALFALPKPATGSGLAVEILNVAAAGAYTLLALIVGAIWGYRRIEGSKDGFRGWLWEDRDPTPAESAAALRAPLRVAYVQAVLWGVAVVIFTAINIPSSPLLGLGVGLTVLMGGVTTSAVAYLQSELALRPVTSRALSRGQASRRGVPGVATRWLLAWSLGTGVPVVGLLVLAIVAVSSELVSRSALAVSAIALCAIALVFGALLSALAAYATVHPIRSIRRGLARVAEGDLEAQVRVWDSTEVGQLQAGFNEMVEGLAERERLRDAFGRQVGEDVARQALEGELELGGETREVAVLFVDVIGSTELAAERSAHDVVELLNSFFGEVVEVVEQCGGWINKFEGDAALAVFGAPIAADDAEGSALRAGRELSERLGSERTELRAGIGVSCGAVAAGNVGAERRYEYTVIGDPVNEAARLTELAKDHDPALLASAATVERADRSERERWTLGDEVELRGRPATTRLAHPA